MDEKIVPCTVCGDTDVGIVRSGPTFWVRCVNGGRTAHRGYDGPVSGSRAGAISAWTEEQGRRANVQ